MIKKILLLCVSFFIFSCQPKDDDRAKRKKEIDIKVREQVANYTRVRKENCKAAILKEAGEIVDSMLIREARLKIDSLGKPPKPQKPEKPALLEITDSSEVAPFFTDSTLIPKEQ